MTLAGITEGAGVLWMAEKAADLIGVPIGKAAKEVVDDVVSTAALVAMLPANINIGRIINTIV